MKGTMKPKSPQTGAEVQRQLTVSSSTGSPLVPENTKTVPLEPSSTVPRSETQNSTVEKPLLPNIESHQNFITLPQKSSSPLQTNKASSMQNPVQAENQSDHTSSNTSAETPVPSLPTPPFVPPTSPPVPVPSLVQRLRQAEDKTLCRRPTPVTISENGRPRILILDSVFKKRTAIHKDFIIWYYNGKAPPFNQIQSMFNHMWGKGKKLEIHNNPLNRSTIVRIPNAYLREKILEKNIWYVGDSMFHTAQWTSERSKATPPLKAIKIWAHLIGVPLDLRHKEGLTMVAGLIGDPKETDDFTKNLVSLTLSHVKVEVDFTVPLPSVVEFVRQSASRQLPVTVFSTVQSSLSSPDIPRPSLKRSRSSQTFTPGHGSNPNPFCSSSNPPIQNLFNTSDPPLTLDPKLPSIKNSTSADDTSLVSKGSSQLNGNPFYLLS
ncbi:hypothetical protein Bca4012_090178 [Brassica carinata]